MNSNDFPERTFKNSIAKYSVFFYNKNSYRIQIYQKEATI